MSGISQWLSHIHHTVNSVVWGTPGLGLLLVTGVLMSGMTGWFQFLRVGHWLRATLGSLFCRPASRRTEGSVSPFQAMCTALAASLGVGNIAGVAAAITAGGPGAIFWMWVAALIGMMTGFSENVLGMYYRRRGGTGWVGGAMYYLRDGLGKRRGCRWLGKGLAAAFALFCLLASFGIGNLGQVNAIVTHLEHVFPVAALSHPTLGNGTLYGLILGAVLTVVMAVVLWGGVRRITRLAERLVPAMVGLFLLGCIGVLCHHYRQILPAFGAIFRGAFTPQAALGGTAGAALRQVITCGFRRGMFSNEAGMGSSVLIHVDAEEPEPVRQGMWNLFEIFIDTLVMCTVTALVVLVSGVVDLRTGRPVYSTMDSTTLVASAFCDTFGPVGEQFVAIAILLFAFSTLLGWSHYGSKAAAYLGGDTAVAAYRVLFVALLIPGTCLPTALSLEVADTFNGLMMLPNLVGVLALSGEVRAITRNYIDRHIRHKAVKPLVSYRQRMKS